MSYTRKLKTMEILAEALKENPENFDNRTCKEIKGYLKKKYPCSDYCAYQAAMWLAANRIPDEATDIKNFPEKQTYLSE